TRATCFPRYPASWGSLPDVMAIKGKRVGQRGPIVYLVIPLRATRWDRYAYSLSLRTSVVDMVGAS
ncbi:MAG TPA: hypothetical protein VGY54_00865, partial [Polyangiaceae bacterium]|nr:hypothetical protein [Polyangiaceae bacterium]